MRFSSLALLLLASATPALAADPDEQRPSAVNAERLQPRADRSRPRFDRVERMPRAERIQRAERVQPVEARTEPPAPAQVRAAPEPRPERLERRERRGRWAAPVTAGEVPAQPADGVSQWRSRERNAERRRRLEQIPPASLPSAPPPVLGEVQPGPRAVVPPASGARATERRERRVADALRDRVAAEGWRQEWRKDRRYDWRRHRDRDRKRFRVGIYIDPFGWGYRPWQLGWRMPSRFYSSHYWINDPWHFRLPPAYGPYRWVRYWNDALLVDLRTGRVVDVIPGFFW